MTQNPNLAALSAAGVSVWLDDLSRERLQTGNLQNLIDTRSIVGVTTNPSIFQAALSKGTAYDAQVSELAERGADVDATTIRAVQRSVGLYAGLTVSGDLCLLVFPSDGAGVVTCASPDRIASDGLRIAWTTEFPSRNRDGSTGLITGDVTATWSGDDLITLTTPDRILAY